LEAEKKKNRWVLVLVGDRQTGRERQRDRETERENGRARYSRLGAEQEKTRKSFVNANYASSPTAFF
jgi:hypothetical protein